MRKITLLTLLVFSTCFFIPGSGHADEKEDPGIFLGGGSGIAEFAHAEAGYFVSNRMTVEAQYKWVFLNHMVGIGSVMYYSGGPRDNLPPKFSLLLGASLMTNPTLEKLKLTSEENKYIGSSLILYHGWSWVPRSRISVRLMGGAMIFRHSGKFDAAGLVNIGFGFIGN